MIYPLLKQTGSWLFSCQKVGQQSLGMWCASAMHENFWGNQYVVTAHNTSHSSGRQTLVFWSAQ
jgi:hypothetical protein